MIPARFVLLATLTLVPRHAQSEPVTITVRGGVRIDVHADSTATDVLVQGHLLDDTGRGLADAAVQVLPPTAPEARDAMVRSAQACAGLAPPVVQDVALNLPTDPSGAFCLRLARPASVDTLQLRFLGNAFHDPSEVAVVSLIAQEATVQLAFLPVPRLFPVERRRHSVWVLMDLSPPQGAGSPSVELALSVATPGEPPKQLAVRSARPGQRVEFQLPAEAFGSPGPAVLSVAPSANSPLRGPAAHAPIERTATVELTVVGVEMGSDASWVTVAVDSRAGRVSGGMVEALVGDRSVATASVSAGRAQLPLTLRSADIADVPVTLRYLPNAPGWLAGSPATVSVPVRGPSVWRRMPWAIAAVLLTAWIVRAWLRPARRTRDHALSDSPPQHSGKASVSVVEASSTRLGWHGIVLDAHDGSPVPNARIELVLPSFGAGPPGLFTTSDTSGHFRLDVATAPPEGAHLIVSSRYHSTLTQIPPVPGTLAITVVQRRRALLDRLAAWAQPNQPHRLHAGHAAVTTEPTPDDVATHAEQQGRPDVALWARAVEHAAYGPLPVDQGREEQVRAHEPRGNLALNNKR